MIAVQCLAYAVMTTRDVGRLTAYYRETIGLGVSTSSAKQAVLTDGSGNDSLIIEQGEHEACPRLGFEVPDGLALSDIRAGLKAFGIDACTGSDPLPAVSGLATFVDPKGTAIDLIIRRGRPPATSQKSGALAPLKLGHVAYKVEAPAEIAQFYTDALGFRVSDWVETMFAFLRCGPDHHTVNFLRAPQTALHHIAFELKDWAHMALACDHLSRAGRPIIWGPGRHRVGHNGYIYHRDPDDHVVEFYVELDQMKNEELGYFEPRPWHEEFPQRPKVWGREEGLPMWGAPPTPDFRRSGSDHLVQASG